MFGLKILRYPHEKLNTVCSPVTVFDANLGKLVAGMISSMKRENGIGLAAPQVGRLQNVIIIDTRGSDSVGFFGALINPEITQASSKFVFLEGCLSLPNEKYWTERADNITVKFQTTSGVEITRDFRGVTAVAIQHEAEHLLGVTLRESGAVKR